MFRISTISRVILSATVLVWLSTVAVMVTSSVALERGIFSGVLDGTFFAFPVLLLGLVLHWSLRKRGQDPVTTPLSPLQAGFLGTWLANAIVLGIINALSLITIVNSGRHIGESALIYIVVWVTWGLSIGAGVAGWGIAVILRDRRQARSS